MRAAILLLVGACAGTAPGGSPAVAPAPERSGPVKVGDRTVPIAGAVAIPVKGAKLTMVNYFATWCTSSQRWMPHVEEMRKKHAGAGLAVTGS